MRVVSMVVFTPGTREGGFQVGFHTRHVWGILREIAAWRGEHEVYWVPGGRA